MSTREFHGYFSRSQVPSSTFAPRFNLVSYSPRVIRRRWEFLYQFYRAKEFEGTTTFDITRDPDSYTTLIALFVSPRLLFLRSNLPPRLFEFIASPTWRFLFIKHLQRIKRLAKMSYVRRRILLKSLKFNIRCYWSNTIVRCVNEKLFTFSLSACVIKRDHKIFKVIPARRWNEERRAVLSVDWITDKLSHAPPRPSIFIPQHTFDACPASLTSSLFFSLFLSLFHPHISSQRPHPILIDFPGRCTYDL